MANVRGEKNVPLQLPMNVCKRLSRRSLVVLAEVHQKARGKGNPVLRLESLAKIVLLLMVKARVNPEGNLAKDSEVKWWMVYIRLLVPERIRGGNPPAGIEIDNRVNFTYRVVARKALNAMTGIFLTVDFTN